MMRISDRAILCAAAGVAGVALLLACGEDSKNRRAIRGPVTGGGGGGGGGAPAAVKKVDPTNSGAISGTVKWGGARSDPKRIDVSGNPDCVKISREPIFEEHLVVNPNGTVRFCLVSIDTPDSYEPPAEEAVIDQKNCRYTPHVLAIQTGQKLRIKNSDATNHNVHYIAGTDVNGEENFSMLTGAPDKTRSFGGADWIKFKCDIHPWMGAWCAVRTHPYFAVTGEDGTFTIKNVPAGTHKLVLKHERLGEQSATVTVEAGKTVTQDFTLRP
jgi:plastocyanin